jgi:hypothetical protein
MKKLNVKCNFFNLIDLFIHLFFPSFIFLNGFSTLSKILGWYGGNSKNN